MSNVTPANATNVKDSVMSAVTPIKDAVMSTVTPIKDAVMKAVNSVKEPVKEPAKAVNSKDTSFLQFNSTISKFVFILLMLIVFVLLFQFGMFLLEHTYGTKRTPYVMKGMIDSDIVHVVSSNPNVSKSIPILRSVNELTGIEYTWALWVYIEDPYLNADQRHKRIFSKGTYTMSDSIKNKLYDIAFLNNSPGLYYNAEDNKIVLVINTYSDNKNIYETIEVDNMPIEKWVSCVITLKDRKINIFINGNMSKEYILKFVPKQNYYDTILGDKKGFGGFISNLRYYDHAISSDAIQSIMHDGPDTKKEVSSKVYDAPPWLSMNWYYN